MKYKNGGNKEIKINSAVFFKGEWNISYCHQNVADKKKLEKYNFHFSFSKSHTQFSQHFITLRADIRGC